MDLQSTAQELYALAPADFVAARTAAEKRARAEGDRELARQIRSLGKPTAAAWIANQLVRRHPGEIQGLRELGAGLREATATLQGDDLRRLSQQQNRVVHALVEQAREIASAAGQPMSEATERGIDATLRAALADESLADQLRAGQLTTALEHVGFGESAGAWPAPSPASRAPTQRLKSEQPRKPEQPRVDPRERRWREQRERGLERAGVQVREARASHREASRVLERAESDLAEATASRDRAHRACEQSAHRLDAARQELERLSGQTWQTADP